MRVSNFGEDAFGAPLVVTEYGTQIQDLAIEGVPIEAKITVTHEFINDTYPDGTPYELQKPLYSIQEAQFGSLVNIQTSPRVGQQTIGMGLSLIHI